MKTRTIAITLAVGLVGTSLAFAANANMGTWKLNEAKSKVAAGMPKNHTVSYAAEGDQVKVTVDGTDKDGKPTHSEWTGKFDGKDYPVSGDSMADSRSYTEVNDHTLKMTGKKDGKITLTGTITVSPDGKSRKVKINATDANGKKVTSSTVYDKQ
jgi:ribosomal protein L21E